jgi:hypothetical protein
MKKKNAKRLRGKMKNKILTVALGSLVGLTLIVVALTLSGCTQGQQKGWKHFVSGMKGLPRIITLYSAEGKVIRTWEGNNIMVEMEGSVASFILDGKEYKIAGTYIVEEK